MTWCGKPRPRYFPHGVRYLVSCTPPIVDFSAAPLSGDPPLTVSFTNLSTGDTGISFLWDFGDGSTSTLENPTHTYGSSLGGGGTMTVSLTVINPCGTDTETKVNYITVNMDLSDSVSGATTESLGVVTSPYRSDSVSGATTEAVTPAAGTIRSDSVSGATTEAVTISNT